MTQAISSHSALPDPVDSGDRTAVSGDQGASFDDIYAQATAQPSAAPGGTSHAPGPAAEDRAAASGAKQPKGTDQKAAPVAAATPDTTEAESGPDAAAGQGNGAPLSSLDQVLQRAASGPDTSDATTVAGRVPTAGNAKKTQAEANAAAKVDKAAAQPVQGKTPGEDAAALKLSAKPVGTGAARDPNADETQAGSGVAQPATRRGQDGKRKDNTKTAAMPLPLVGPGAAPHLPHQAARAGGHKTTDSALQGAAALAPRGAAAAGVASASGAAAQAGTASLAESQPQLMGAVADLGGAGGGTARVTLHPDTLGTVVVNVQVTAQGITNIHMTATTDGGYQALAAGAAQLAQHLAHSGLAVGAVQTAMANGAVPQNAAPQNAAPQPQPNAGGFAAGGGFAGSGQNSGGQGQPQPQSPDPLAEATLSPAAPSSPDTTVKAYA